MSEIMTGLPGERRRCPRSMVEDQLRHQARQCRSRFCRQIRPCRRADGAVGLIALEQIHLPRPRLLIVSVSAHGPLPDSGRERICRKAGHSMMLLDPSMQDREVRIAPQARPHSPTAPASAAVHQDMQSGRTSRPELPASDQLANDPECSGKQRHPLCRSSHEHKQGDRGMIPIKHLA